MTQRRLPFAYATGSKRQRSTALVVRLVDAARRRGDPGVIVNAQVAAMPFYSRHGFVATGDVFEEAGIPHRVMERPLRRR